MLIEKINDDVKMQLISQGNTAEIYLYDDTKIIKLFRDNFPYHMITTEYDLSKQASNVLACVPKVFNLAEYKNRYGIVFEKVDGKNMISKMMSNPFKVNSYAKKLARIHSVLLNSSAELNVTIKDKISHNIGLSKDLSEKEKEMLIKYLLSLPDGISLCHMDFHPGNIMFQNNDYFIIDWMTACNGNKNSDIARTYLLLNFGELMHVNKFVKFIAHIFEKHIAKIYLRECKKIDDKTDYKDIRNWLLPLAAARLIEWIPNNEKKRLLKFVRKELSKIS